MLSILLVDDEPSIRLAVGDALAGNGHKVTRASDGGEALALLDAQVFDLVVTDISMPKVDGLTLFRKLREASPSTDVILMTAYGKVTDAVEALKQGAEDYLTKPFSTEEMLVRVQRIDDRRALKRELQAAKSELTGGGIIGQSPVMVRLLDRIDTIAASDASVLILGESGTGKELVARRLHDQSARKAKPFVAVNCAAFPETLIEAELFGHERGAFTGAAQRREGRFKAADGGTLFLDEVAEIPLPVQAKLLRVLQEGVFEPIGTNTPIKVNVRVISATHRDLRARIKEHAFREDLFYRLNVLDVHLPPLRERRGDLPLLVEAFLKRAVGRGGAQPAGISPRAWAALSDYLFPGNVRELQHAIEHAVVLARGGEIDLHHLPRDIVGIAEAKKDQATTAVRTLAVAAKEFEREYLLRALHQADGKKGRAADLLGISRKNLWEKLKGHDIADSDDDA
ncbi:MAG: sigma-54-dependent Fis family transcriptional regulator [Deltaproteobacteria bacterium]|nr:sigma-54-dependent Fis family transcriptional regulator [Deltaproteobacteria bacterium]